MDPVARIKGGFADELPAWFYPLSTDAESRVFALVVGMLISAVVVDYGSARCSQKRPLYPRLGSGTIGVDAFPLEHAKETPAGALSAQLPTALMLQVIRWAAKIRW